MYGGAMIDSGGFGCIYKPALRCSNSKKRYNGISKLQIKKYGLQEYNTTKDIESILKKIPNYTKYYIVKVSKCIPNALTSEDKKKMDCYALTKKNITKKNINNNLSKLVSIQMEYGGPTLKSTIKNIRSYDELMIVHSKVKTFFNEGLLPMNRVGIIHSDMKMANLLYNDSIKVIDWGFTINLNQKFEIREKKFHFNLPFSVVLFERGKYIKMYLENKAVSKNNIREFVIKIMEENKYDRHIEYLEDLYKNLKIENINLYIIEYLTEVMFKFTDKNTKEFNVDKYFDEVYIYNCDIWGFIMMFIEMIDYMNFELLEKTSTKPFIDMIFTLIDKYLLNIKYATEKFNPSEIYNEIDKIGE